MSDTPYISPFEAIRHTSEEDNEYWSARELAKILGYTTNYRNFKNAIEKAKEACENSGRAVSDHFADVRKMIDIGKGAQRSVEDVHLSRYACYLTLQNADPSKLRVALGQTYFAIQTRRQEIADELATFPENKKRIALRAELTRHNRMLAEVAGQAGVVTRKDFAIFQDHGYKGLYGGLRAGDIHARKGLKQGQHISDHMGSEELASNIFRSAQTDAKIRRENIQGKDEANRTHREVGKAVRETIKQLGGTMPEDLSTPEKSIQQLQREEQKRLKEGTQPSLFDEPDPLLP